MISKNFNKYSHIFEYKMLFFKKFNNSQEFSIINLIINILK